MKQQSELAAGSCHVYWSLMQIYEKGQLSEFMREEVAERRAGEWWA